LQENPTFIGKQGFRNTVGDNEEDIGGKKVAQVEDKVGNTVGNKEGDTVGDKVEETQ